MRRKTDSMLFKLALIFVLITLIVIVLSAINTYNRQMDIYEAQCEKNVRNVGEYLEKLMKADSDAFLFYQNYYKEHFAEVNIPYDFDEYTTARQNYIALYEKHHQGKVQGVDIRNEDMDPEVQEAYFIYLHEYWTLTFEAARPVFNLPYTYYLWVKEGDTPGEYSVVYMIDGERTHKPEAEEYLYLGDEYFHTAEEYTVEWDAWSSGEKPEGYQIWDNEWGHTYAYYTPLVINGQKMGLIATEVEVADVEKSILNNTVIQISGLGAVFIMAMIVLLLAIYGGYVSKIVRLADDVREYSETKDTAIADRIYNDAKGNSEITSLAHIVADTINELDAYMRNLVETRQRLNETREKADAMTQLANRDVLTGIRNKTAYDSETRRLDEAAKKGLQYGLMVIDMNNLKNVNDTYGHECGDVAITRLCHHICMVFTHSPVFRVGGDEFAVILKGNDLEHVEELLDTFYGTMEEWKKDAKLKPWEQVSAAAGYVLYDPELDKDARDVFNRADAAMYDRKHEMKA